MSTRHLPLLLIGPVLLALDVLALHDILAREPNLTAEWSVLIASALIFGVLFGLLRRFKPKPRAE